VALSPFYQIHDRRYIVYWDIGTPEASSCGAQRRGNNPKLDARIEARTIDRVDVGEPASERATISRARVSHAGVNGETGARWRDSNQWFSYRLAAKPDRPLELICTWWG